MDENAVKWVRKLVIIGAVIGVYLVFFYGKNGPRLSPAEKSLAERAGVPAATALAVKKDCQSVFYLNPADSFVRPLIGMDYDGNTKAVNAIACTVSHGKTAAVMDKYRAALRKDGLMMFVSEQNYGDKPDELAILKTNDQYDIIRVMATDGINYDIDNAMVVKKLKEWEKTCSFEITGAGQDWMEAVFTKQPADMAVFAKQVYTFCPDVVDQGTGTQEGLAEEMKGKNTLYLWWD